MPSDAVLVAGAPPIDWLATTAAVSRGSWISSSAGRSSSYGTPGIGTGRAVSLSAGGSISGTELRATGTATRTGEGGSGSSSSSSSWFAAAGLEGSPGSANPPTGRLSVDSGGGAVSSPEDGTLGTDQEALPIGAVSLNLSRIAETPPAGDEGASGSERSVPPVF